MSHVTVSPGVRKPQERRWSAFVSRWEYGVGGEDFFDDEVFTRQWQAAQKARFQAEQAQTLERIFTALRRAV